MKKFKEAKIYERSIAWLELVPYHPLYYIDFSDLRKIIEQNNNWTEIFKELFLNKDVTSDTLFGIEPIRNKVAHNRIISELDLKYLYAAYHKVRTLIGPRRFENFLSRSTRYIPIFAELSKLAEEMEAAHTSLVALQPLSQFPQWDRCSLSWWFDEEYLGKPVNEIVAFYNQLLAYSKLPRGWGDGLTVERWVQRPEYSEIAKAAKEAMSAILRDALRATQ